MKQAECVHLKMHGMDDFKILLMLFFGPFVSRSWHLSLRAVESQWLTLFFQTHEAVPHGARLNYILFEEFAIIRCRGCNPVVVSAITLSLPKYLHLLLFFSIRPFLIFNFAGLLSWLKPVPFRCHLSKSWWLLLGLFWISPRSIAVWCVFLCRVIPGFLATFLLLVPYVLCGCFFHVTTEGAVIVCWCSRNY